MPDCATAGLELNVRMRRAFSAIFAAVCAMAVSAAEGTAPVSKPAVRDEIVSVIERQLAAFQEGKLDRAYGYAAESLRVQIPPEGFARMVQQNYPEIWQSTRAEFGIVRDEGGRATVVVRVYAKQSEAAYDYVLLKEASGWRIGGVLRREIRNSSKI